MPIVTFPNLYTLEGGVRRPVQLEVQDEVAVPDQKGGSLRMISGREEVGKLAREAARRLLNRLAV